jgi:hypothetical protein
MHIPQVRVVGYPLRIFALFKMQAKPPRVGSFHYITSLT